MTIPGGDASQCREGGGSRSLAGRPGVGILLAFVAAAAIVWTVAATAGDRLAAAFYASRTEGALHAILHDQPDSALAHYQEAFASACRSLALLLVLIPAGAVVAGLLRGKSFPSLTAIAGRPGLAGFFLLLLVLAGKWNVLDVPYYGDDLGYVIPISKAIHDQGLTPFPVLEEDPGHPPFYFFLLAAAWKVFGVRLAVSHLIGLAFAWCALLFTYLLGRRMTGNGLVGLGAALLLFLDPLCFAQFGTLHLEVPLTALLLASAYFLMAGQWTAFLLAATALALTKSYGFLFVGVLLACRLLVCDWPRRAGLAEVIRRYALLSTPIFAYMIWFLLHYRFTGILINTFENTRQIHLSPVAWAVGVARHSRQVFLHGNGFLFLAVAMTLIAHVRSRRLPGRDATFVFAVLAGLIAVLAIFKVSNVRYAIPAYPLAALLAAWCLRDFVANGRSALRAGYAMAAVAVTTFAFVSGWHHERGAPAPGTSTDIANQMYYENMEYLDVVDLYGDVGRCLERHFPGRRVLAYWPLAQALHFPHLGYIDKPVQVVTNVSDCGVLLLTPHDEVRLTEPQVASLLADGNLTWLRRLERNGKYVDLFAKKLPPRRGEVERAGSGGKLGEGP
jgi:hypothetical protein